MDELEQQARELLAAEYEKAGLDICAKIIREQPLPGAPGIRAIVAALSQQRAVPEGWALVPREATEEMRSTFRADQPASTYFTHTTVQLADFDSRYRAMLAAAPQPPAEAQARATHCQNGRADVCLASQRDGVVCPDDECDIDGGMRHDHTKPAEAQAQGGWYRYSKPAPRWEDTKFGKWLDPAVYGPPREQHGYSLEVAPHAQQPAAVDGDSAEALKFLLSRIGSWTNARWDQHLRHEFGDERAERMIATLAAQQGGES